MNTNEVMCQLISFYLFENAIIYYWI